MHKPHSLDYENPQEVWQDKHQQMFSLNVWGWNHSWPSYWPLFIPGSSWLRNVPTVSQNWIDSLLDAEPLDVIQRMWFMHDGAPPQFTLIVRQYLDNKFQNRWSGWGGSIEWPAWSPDLNPMDFYFWGHLKSLVYSTPVPNINVLGSVSKMDLIKFETP